MGLGQFGGGLGAVQWLHSLGAKVLVTDRSSAAALADPLRSLAAAIERNEVTLRLGEHRAEDFERADLVVVNAAVPRPWENQFINIARVNGVEVTTEIRLAVERLGTSRTIGITGSSGKSTTTAMTESVLNASGRRVHVGGNFGGSLLDCLPFAPDEWVLLELSSAQLWWLSAESGGAPWSPAVAALTNLAPNHVDWHGTLNHYLSSKNQIRRDQHLGNCFVSGFDLVPASMRSEMERECHLGAWWEGAWRAPVPDPSTLDLILPGEHQQRNAWLALSILAACSQIDGRAPAPDVARTALRSFSGLAHRLQPLGEVLGVRCFNDSKATTPEATLLAIASVGPIERIHLIAGGYDKKVDLSPITALAPKLAGLYAIGATGSKLAAQSPAIECGTLAKAVETAFERARPGETLLLSPGCASWDQFTNFEERGNRFAELVRDRGSPRRC